jgi:hypothetical protein
LADTGATEVLQQEPTFTLPPPPVAAPLGKPTGRIARAEEELDPLDIADDSSDAQSGTASRGSSTATLLADKNRSGLLVVLDDDEEAPPEQERHTASIKRNSTNTSIPGLAADERPKGGSVDLPDLPDLPDLRK